MSDRIPSVTELDIAAMGQETLDELLDKRGSAKADIKNLASIAAECDIKIGAILDLNATKAVRWREEYVVSRREPSKPRKSIDPVKLMELGVPASVIKAATVYGAPSKPGVSVRRYGPGEESAEKTEAGPEGQVPDGYWDEN